MAGPGLAGGSISAVEACNDTVSQYNKLHRDFPKRKAQLLGLIQRQWPGDSALSSCAICKDDFLLSLVE